MNHHGAREDERKNSQLASDEIDSEYSPIDIAPASLQDAGILLAFTGLALFGVFLSNLLGILFSTKALDPSWQLRLGELLIGSAPFALLGSCLMLLAAFLDADQPLIERWWLHTRKLAGIACLGYLC